MQDESAISAGQGILEIENSKHGNMVGHGIRNQSFKRFFTLRRVIRAHRVSPPAGKRWPLGSSTERASTRPSHADVDG